MKGYETVEELNRRALYDCIPHNSEVYALKLHTLVTEVKITRTFLLEPFLKVA